MTRIAGRVVISGEAVEDQPSRMVPARPSVAVTVNPTAWRGRYTAALVLADAVCAVVAVALGWAVRFGFPHDTGFGRYLLVSGLISAAWLGCLQIAGAYELRKVSTGAAEAQRVLRAALTVAGGLAIVAYLLQWEIARTFVAIVFPVGALLQISSRYAIRCAVYARRSRGDWAERILAIGNAESVRQVIEATSRNPNAGLRVVAACVDGRAPGSEIAPGVPVIGAPNQAAFMAEQAEADVIAIAGGGLGPRSVRELGWQLEGTGRKLVMAPGLTEVAGPRVHISPVEGLPLMWVDQPQFTGFARIVKRGMDLLLSSIILLALSPVLLVIALMVGLTSRGPALYRSTRTGLDGRPFKTYKFRSMYADADARKAELLAENEVAGGVLFKMRNDPRVTPVGRILRKFSLDELPQLFNVLDGSMSLVGPRPPLPDEVEQYDGHVHRRLLVKPGMTGLWQVKGRSDLPWDEAVRLDLYYVENWSLALDLAIIVRTVWVVIRADGAY